MRYLSIDHGLKRTGLAICDPDEIICSPLEVIDNPAVLLDKITEVIKSYQIEEIIIGLPLNMDGSEGSQAGAVKKFAKTLQERIGDLPIHLHDERLSSFNAHEKISTAEYTNKKRKKRVDAIAAAEILRSFLDWKQGQ